LDGNHSYGANNKHNTSGYDIDLHDEFLLLRHGGRHNCEERRERTRENGGILLALPLIPRKGLIGSTVDG